jgi:protocatechuate 3,4-dioxygenase, beta subunit
MTAHTLRFVGAGALVAAGLVVTAAAQVDREWVQQWTEAQRHRPAAIATHARIAPPDEPGVPLVIHGAVLAPDGKTPVKDAIVFAYHADRQGRYAPPGMMGDPWRLEGWARTDAEGRFEFTTIRPAPYPNRRIPAHIHLTIESARFGRQTSGIQFADDPLVADDDRGTSLAVGPQGSVLAVRADGEAQHVEYRVRLLSKGTF